MRLLVGNHRSGINREEVVIIDGQSIEFIGRESQQNDANDRHSHVTCPPFEFSNVSHTNDDRGENVRRQLRQAMCSETIRKVYLMRLSFRELLCDVLADPRRAPWTHDRGNAGNGNGDTSAERKTGSAVRCLPQWTSIDVFACTDLGPDAVRFLLSVSSSHLQRLSLSLSQPNTASTPLSSALSEGLKRCSGTLRYLTIFSAEWDADTIAGLCDGIQSTTCLEELNLSTCTFGRRQMSSGSAAAAAAAAAAPGVTEDDHNQNEEEEEEETDTPPLVSVTAATAATPAIRLLASTVAQVHTLRCLQLNQCQLDSADVIALAEALEGHPALTRLTLESNACQQHTFAVVTRFLQAVPSLKVIGLSHQLEPRQAPAVTDDAGGDGNDHVQHTRNRRGPLHLLRACFQSPACSLQALHLSSNKLTNCNIEHLARAISRCRSIQHLDLKNNKITDIGITALSQNLPPFLQRLWLHGNAGISPVGAHSLLDAVQCSHVHLIDVRIPTYYVDQRRHRHPRMQRIQSNLQYYCRLNHGGRHLLFLRRTADTFDGSMDTSTSTNGPGHGAALVTSTPTGPAPRGTQLSPSSPSAPCIPMSLWPHVLARVHRLQWERDHATDRGRIEVLYHFLRHLGPMVVSPNR